MEDKIAIVLKIAGVKFEREFKFHPTRKWRADFCLTDHKILLEYEGGVYNKGRHMRMAGYSGDCIKYNAATILGYRILRYTHKELGVKNGVFKIIEDLKQMGVVK